MFSSVTESTQCRQGRRLRLKKRRISILKDKLIKSNPKDSFRWFFSNVWTGNFRKHELLCVLAWPSCPLLCVRLRHRYHLHVLGPDCWPLFSVGTTVCFYRWLQKPLLWPAVIPDHKSQTPSTKYWWMRQQIRSIKQDILHSIFQAVQPGPQSVHLSLFLLSPVCCLLLERHETEASGG